MRGRFSFYGEERQVELSPLGEEIILHAAKAAIALSKKDPCEIEIYAAALLDHARALFLAAGEMRESRVSHS